jgi:threonine dehydrogenase-like Zn-dependent dehydrogenase
VATRFPGVRVQLVDTDPRRAAVAATLGVEFATPDAATADRDLVIHASATSAGLTRSLELLVPEGTVVELSWYGDRPVSVPLGEHFHSRRLIVRSSQVGTVSPAVRGRRDFGDRLAIALDLLADPAFDALITGRCDFDDLPAVLPRLAAADPPPLCHLVEYQTTPPDRTPDGTT